MLTSPRLSFRRFVPADLELLHEAIYRHPEVAQMLSPTGVLTIHNTEYILYHCLKHWQEHGFGSWALFCQSTQQLVGHCGLQYLEDLPELSYTIHPHYWGQGLATEAAQVVLQWGFETLQFQQIVAVTGLNNHASQRVMQKLGMQYEKNMQYHGSEVAYYKLDRQDYRSRIASAMRQPDASQPEV